MARTMAKKARKLVNTKMPNKGWGFYIQKITKTGNFYPDQLFLICLNRYRRGNTFYFDFKVIKGKREDGDHSEIDWWYTSENTSVKNRVSLSTYCGWMREEIIRKLTDEETARALLLGVDFGTTKRFE
jgi:hypothetical protein